MPPLFSTEGFQHRFAKISEFDRPMASFRPAVMGIRADRTRFLHRKGHDGSRGSPRFFTAQRTIVRNDNAGSAIDLLIYAVAQRERRILQRTATLSDTGECWGLGCLRRVRRGSGTPRGLEPT